MTINIALLALIAALTSSQAATKGPSGQTVLVYSGNASFWTDAPAGWILDDKAGKRDGPIVVLYRRGKTWQTSEPVMFATAIFLNDGVALNLSNAIQTDIASWRSKFQDLIVKEGEAVRTAGGETAAIRKFQSAAGKHYDSVAYIVGPHRVWLLALSARSLREHDEGYSDFLKWVRSYASGPTVKIP